MRPDIIIHYFCAFLLSMAFNRNDMLLAYSLVLKYKESTGNFFHSGILCPECDRFGKNKFAYIYVYSVYGYMPGLSVSL